MEVPMANAARFFFRRRVPRWVRRTSFESVSLRGPWRIEVEGESGGVWTLVPSRPRAGFGSAFATEAAGTLTCAENGLWFLYAGEVLEGHIRDFLTFDGPVEELSSLASFFERGARDNW
jgi:hypothetical protein